jgi:hypothetical protein
MLKNKNATVVLNGRKVNFKSLALYVTSDEPSKSPVTEFILVLDEGHICRGEVRGIEVINENIHSKRKETVSKVSYSLKSISSE